MLNDHKLTYRLVIEEYPGNTAGVYVKFMEDINIRERGLVPLPRITDLLKRVRAVKNDRLEMSKIAEEFGLKIPPRG